MKRPRTCTILILSAVVAVVGTWSFWPSISRWLEATTTGSIYVSGPQIYTRERLVNDRYREDAWLSTELTKAPERNFGVTMSTSMFRSDVVGVGGSIGQDKGPDIPERTKPDVPAAIAVEVSPQDRLNALRAFREQIRTSMIENQLDDRHDLRGNSLYRLHFDAAVLPGTNTQAGARVTVSVLPPDNLLGKHGIEKMANQAVRDREVALSQLKRFHQLSNEEQVVWERIYARWLESLTKRFEDGRKAIIGAYETNRFSSEDYDRILQAAQQDATTLWSGLETQARDPGNGAAMQKLSPERRKAATIGLKSALLKPSAKDASAMQAMRDVEARNDRVDFGDSGHTAFKREIERIIDLNKAAISLVSEIGVNRALLRSTDAKSTPAPDSGGSGLPSAAAPSLAASDGCGDLITYGALGAPVAAVASIPYSLQQLIDRQFEQKIFNTVLGLGLSTIAESNTLRKFAQGLTTPGAAAHAFDFAPQRPSFIVTNKKDCFPRDIRPFVRDLASGHQTVYYLQANIDVIRQFLPEYDPADDIAELVRQKWAEPSYDPSTTHVDTLFVDAGLINFIRMAGRQLDVFSYAFTPSEPDELNAIQSRDENARSLAAGATAAALGKTAAGTLKAEREAIELRHSNALRKLVVSFGEQPNSVTARFGWVIQPQEPTANNRYRHRASQTSLTALVSLPAWWEEVRVNIVLSWDGEHENTRKSQDYIIVLPVNFETVDASLFEANDRSPVITEWVMNGLSVTPCQKTDLIIPGRRLWRSTVVTLGGQRANGIYVMPDMNGIVASFEKLDFPSTWTNTAKDYKAPLTVWTSQGSAPTQWVTFHKLDRPPNRDCSKSAN